MQIWGATSRHRRGLLHLLYSKMGVGQTHKHHRNGSSTGSSISEKTFPLGFGHKHGLSSSILWRRNGSFREWQSPDIRQTVTLQGILNILQKGTAGRMCTIGLTIKSFSLKFSHQFLPCCYSSLSQGLQFAGYKSIGFFTQNIFFFMLVFKNDLI